MKKIITYGSFDLFHEGHYRILERAKALGDYLIVGVTSDDYDRMRGKINNQQSLMERIEWMYEHEERRKELSELYQKKGKEYALPLMVDKLENMFFLAVEEKKNGQDLPTLFPSKKDEKRKKKMFERLVKEGIIPEMPESLR